MAARRAALNSGSLGAGRFFEIKFSFLPSGTTPNVDARETNRITRSARYGTEAFTHAILMEALTTVSKWNSCVNHLTTGATVHLTADCLKTQLLSATIASLGGASSECLRYQCVWEPKGMTRCIAAHENEGCVLDTFPSPRRGSLALKSKLGARLF